MKHSFAFLLFSLSCQLFAQKVSITGVVKDFADKSALPFATVFVEGTTYGTQSDSLGKFSLSFPLPRKAELVFSMVGYESKSVFIETETTSRVINIELQTKIEALNELTISGKKDKEWKRNFERFKRSFLGTDAFAKQSEIENYWVIDFDKRKSQLAARSNEPLKISNKLLGYEVLTELVKFEATQGITDYVVKSFYKETAVDKGKSVKRDELRVKAYNGSLRHFLASLAQDKLKENGFDFFQLEGKTVRRGIILRELATTKYKDNLANPSMIRVNTDSTFSFPQGAMFIVINQNKTVGPQPIFKDVSNATSIIYVSGSHRFDRYGNIDQPLALEISGDMDTYRLAHTLPTDYQPGTTTQSETIQTILDESEIKLGSLKILTSKDIFVPGERLYFTAFQEGTGFTDHQPLNVSIYDSAGKEIEHRYFRFSGGISSGYIYLDKQLPVGQYHVSFYTDWMSDYPGLITTEPIIIAKGILPKAVKMCPTSKIIKLTTSPLFEELGINQKILNDSTQKITITNIPSHIEHLAVSLTATESLLSLDNTVIITEQSEAKTISKAKLNELMTADSLLTIRGKLINELNQKPLKKHNLTLVSYEPNNAFAKETTSENDGTFEFTGLNINGQKTLVFQIADKRRRAVKNGNILLYDNLENKIDLNCKSYPLSNKSLGFISSDRLAEDDTSATLLEEVTVKANRIPGTAANGLSKKTFIGDTQNYVSIVDMINQMPGVNFNYSTGKFSLRNNILYEPLILVNDLPLPGSVSEANSTTPGKIRDWLNQFSPRDVVSIEILKEAESSLYGIRAAGGAIKIVLKNGINNSVHSDPTAKLLTITGFSPLNTTFKGAKTVYWNSNIHSEDLNNRAFSFHTSTGSHRNVIARLLGKSFDGKVVIYRTETINLK